MIAGLLYKVSLFMEDIGGFSWLYERNLQASGAGKFTRNLGGVVDEVIEVRCKCRGGRGGRW